MILELLEWIATPCSWSARTNGLLAAQIGIRHRARRCRAAWKPHLDACRQFVAESVGPSPADETLTILGSGHLNDFDLEFLQRRFIKITLVDAVHPIEIQIRASVSRGRLRLITTDLSSPTAEIALKFLIVNAIWIPIHLAWLAAGVTLRRLDLPPRVQSAINVGMAVSMLAVVALAALAPR